MKKVAGFHSLDFGALFCGVFGSRFRRNLGIMEVHTEVFATLGIEVEEYRIAFWWEDIKRCRGESCVRGRCEENVIWLESLAIPDLEAISI